MMMMMLMMLMMMMMFMGLHILPSNIFINPFSEHLCESCPRRSSSSSSSSSSLGSGWGWECGWG
eukprot:5086472-Karenia_brevis.AAC.1